MTRNHDTDPNAAFQDVLRHFDTAMLVTRTPEGTLRARPMAIAECDEHGDLWFVTSIDAPKTDEIRADAHVAITMQSSSRFLSLSGSAELVRDRARIEALWRESWKAWFPMGKTDPAIALVHVNAREGEYWDQHGTRGLKYAFDAARAVARGKSARDAVRPEQHGKVQL